LLRLVRSKENTGDATGGSGVPAFGFWRRAHGPWNPKHSSDHGEREMNWLVKTFSSSIGKKAGPGGHGSSLLPVYCGPPDGESHDLRGKESFLSYVDHLHSVEALVTARNSGSSSSRCFTSVWGFIFSLKTVGQTLAYAVDKSAEAERSDRGLLPTAVRSSLFSSSFISLGSVLSTR